VRKSSRGAAAWTLALTCTACSVEMGPPFLLRLPQTVVAAAPVSSNLWCQMEGVDQNPSGCCSVACLTYRAAGSTYPPTHPFATAPQGGGDIKGEQSSAPLTGSAQCIVVREALSSPVARIGRLVTLFLLQALVTHCLAGAADQIARAGNRRGNLITHRSGANFLCSALM